MTRPPDEGEQRFEDGEVVSVLTTRPVDGCLDYLAPEGVVRTGELVEVPLGASRSIGVVWGPGEGAIEAGRLRRIERRLDAPPINAAMRNFLERAGRYTLTPLTSMLRLCTRVPGLAEARPTRTVYSPTGILPNPETPARMSVLRAFKDRGDMPMPTREIAELAGVSAAVVKGLENQGVLEPIKVAKDRPYQSLQPDHRVLELTPDQQRAASRLREKASVGQFSTTLLKGVTGSGKTEVYLEAVAETLGQGRQALVLLPEIALTEQFLRRVAERFGARPGEWHSDITPAERRRLWRSVGEGDVQLVVGARSALFLPFRNLGLIVVDEEHDASYKQEEGAIYNARDMSVLRASLCGAQVVLASATPSLETWNNARTGKYDRVDLPVRVGATELPEMGAIDMREAELPSGRWISGALALTVREAVERGEQALLFLNRRGYAPMTICRACGFQFVCPECDVRMVEHRFREILMCHQCGSTRPTTLVCPQCGEEGALVALGPGVERLAEEARELFPGARIQILSSDIAEAGRGFRETIERIKRGDTDIIIGTQLVAKGHHFPGLTVVGAIDADFSLKSDDFRAAERTFQLMTQVAGRSGRSDTGRRGVALLQTCDPEHQVIRAILSGDDEAFLSAEASERQVAGVPPFGRYVGIVVSGRNSRAVEDLSVTMVRNSDPIDRIGGQMFGPAPAQLFRVRGRTRFRILIKADAGAQIQAAILRWMRQFQIPSSLRVSIDIDPQRFL